MRVFQWFWDNWSTILQDVGIIGGLLFTAASFRVDAKARRVGNLLAITGTHREIWAEKYKKPELKRISRGVQELENEPISDDEELFIRFLILHLNSVHYARREGMLLNIEGLHKDIKEFFSLPVVTLIWERLKPLQDAEFVDFIESARRKY
jgi:hypothetical protein